LSLRPFLEIKTLVIRKARDKKLAKRPDSKETTGETWLVKIRERVELLETEVIQLKEKLAESKNKLVRLAKHRRRNGSTENLIEVHSTNPQSRLQKLKENFYAKDDRSVSQIANSPNRFYATEIKARNSNNNVRGQRHQFLKSSGRSRTTDAASNASESANLRIAIRAY
jgi:hypothetical protein